MFLTTKYAQIVNLEHLLCPKVGGTNPLVPPTFESGGMCPPLAPLLLRPCSQTNGPFINKKLKNTLDTFVKTLNYPVVDFNNIVLENENFQTLHKLKVLFCVIVAIPFCFHPIIGSFSSSCQF